MLPRKLPLQVFVLFLAGVLPARCHADQPSVAEILTKVSETYENLHSYEFVAQKITEIAAVGSIEPAQGGRIQSNFHKSSTSEIVLAIVNPQKFRLDVKEGGGGLLLVSDGQTKWTYLPKRRQYTEESAAGSTLPDVLRSYSALLADRCRGLSQYGSSAVLEKDSQLKVAGSKIDCYVIKIQTQHGTFELWVDKDRYLVWRSKRVGPADSEGISFQETATVNLSQATVNSDLEEGLFQFTPPEKADKVTSLDSKK